MMGIDLYNYMEKQSLNFVIPVAYNRPTKQPALMINKHGLLDMIKNA